MKFNKRLIANITEIVIGVILTICGATGLLDSYWSGMGTALIVVGGLMMIRQVRYSTNAEYKESVDVEIQDERNKFLRVKAWSWAGYFAVLIGAVASIVLRILGQNQLSQFAGLSVCVLMVLYWASYFILKKKY
jgi:drug/metabolite transporter (DMT)-like permease